MCGGEVVDDGGDGGGGVGGGACSGQVVFVSVNGRMREENRKRDVPRVRP